MDPRFVNQLNSNGVSLPNEHEINIYNKKKKNKNSMMRLHCLEILGPKEGN